MNRFAMEFAEKAHGGPVLVHGSMEGEMIMTHPGMPPGWALLILAGMGLITALALATASPREGRERFANLATMPVVGLLVRFLVGSPWPLVVLRSFMVAAFLAVIVAGLFGTPMAQRNLATVLTWNLWWILIIISVFFLGSAWCSVCPWDTLAGWLVKGRLWKRGSGKIRGSLRVPLALRRVWPALILFIGFTWLELNFGLAHHPFLTALLALLMVVLAISSLATFERKAFCRYFCPVGRTIGFYSQLAPVELRPVENDVCADCTTLECYHGTEEVEPCPTNLTMGRFAQNTYCTSCGACVLSCPHDNVAWRLRSVAHEARTGARPHWDEAWFILVLWTITAFHGITMTPFWWSWMRTLGGVVGDTGILDISFSLGMAAVTLLPILVYAGFVALTRSLSASDLSFRRWFSILAFSLLPVAFAYHLSHNLSHLTRETGNLGEVLADPLGTGTMPMGTDTMAMKPMDMMDGSMDLLIPEQLLFALQAGLVFWGFWVAVQVLRHRGRGLLGEGRDLAGWRLTPMLVMVGGATAVSLFLLTREMVMRMG